MLAIINEDLHDHDVIVTGLDWVDPAEMEPMTPAFSDLAESREGWITQIKRHEARIYLSD